MPSPVWHNQPATCVSPPFSHGSGHEDLPGDQNPVGLVPESQNNASMLPGVGVCCSSSETDANAFVFVRIQVEPLQTSKAFRLRATNTLAECKELILQRLADQTNYRESCNWGFLYDPFLEEPPRSAQPYGDADDQSSTASDRLLASIPSRTKASVTPCGAKRFLDDQLTFAYYGLLGEVALEFRPRFRIIPQQQQYAFDDTASIVSTTRSSIFGFPGRSSPREKKQSSRSRLDKSHLKKLQIRFLDLVSRFKHEKVAKLLDDGVDPNFHSPGGAETPLITALMAEDVKMMALLVERGGAFIDYRSPDTRAPIHWAAANDKRRSLNLLIARYAAHLDIRDETKNTPLHLACAAGNEFCVQALVTAHALPNSVDYAGRSPLHFACSKAHPICVDILLRYGALVNATNNVGNTPLHIAACSTSSPECAALLLRCGADRAILNHTSQTSHQVALLSCNYQVINTIAHFNSSVIELPPKPTPDMYHASLEPHPFNASSPSTPVSSNSPRSGGLFSSLNNSLGFKTKLGSGGTCTPTSSRRSSSPIQTPEIQAGNACSSPTITSFPTNSLSRRRSLPPQPSTHLATPVPLQSGASQIGRSVPGSADIGGSFCSPRASSSATLTGSTACAKAVSESHQGSSSQWATKSAQCLRAQKKGPAPAPPIASSKSIIVTPLSAVGEGSSGQETVGTSGACGGMDSSLSAMSGNSFAVNLPPPPGSQFMPPQYAAGSIHAATVSALGVSSEQDTVGGTEAKLAAASKTVLGATMQRKEVSEDTIGDDQMSVVQAMASLNREQHRLFSLLLKKNATLEDTVCKLRKRLVDLGADSSV